MNSFSLILQYATNQFLKIRLKKIFFSLYISFLNEKLKKKKNFKLQREEKKYTNERTSEKILRRKRKQLRN